MTRCRCATRVPRRRAGGVQEAARAGHEAHLVGGGVRDMLLGRVPADFDVATDAVPEAVVELFGKTFAIPTGLKHGTVTVLTDTAPPRHVEVTTFRGEGAYLDGRRPSSVTYVKSLAEDLSRRDFTMNAVAYDPIADARHRSVRRPRRSVARADPRGGRSDRALSRGRPAADARGAAGGPAGVRHRSADAGRDPADAGRVPQGVRRTDPRRAAQDAGGAAAVARPRADARHRPPRRGDPGAARGRRLHAEPISQARRLRSHDARRGRDAGRSDPAAGRAAARRGQAARPPAARGRARRVQLLPARVRRRRDGRRDLPPVEAGQRRTRARRRHREEPHVLLSARLDRRDGPALRPPRRRPRGAGRSVRAARGRRRGARLRRGSRERARRAARRASRRSPPRTRS